jgi:hypothetical protein
MKPWEQRQRAARLNAACLWWDLADRQIDDAYRLACIMRDGNLAARLSVARERAAWEPVETPNGAEVGH